MPEKMGDAGVSASMKIQEVKQVHAAADFIVNKDKAGYRSMEQKFVDSKIGGGEEDAFLDTESLKRYLTDGWLTADKISQAISVLQSNNSELSSLGTRQKQEWITLLEEAKTKFSEIQAQTKSDLQKHESRQGFALRLDGSREWNKTFDQFKTKDGSYDVYSSPSEDKKGLDIRIDDSLWKDTVITNVPKDANMAQVLADLAKVYEAAPAVKQGDKISFEDLKKKAGSEAVSQSAPSAPISWTNPDVTSTRPDVKAEPLPNISPTSSSAVPAYVQPESYRVVRDSPEKIPADIVREIDPTKLHGEKTSQEVVRQIQELLVANRNKSVNVNGDYDPRTFDAVEALQKELAPTYKIKVDGIFGKDTLEAFKRSLANDPTPIAKSNGHKKGK